MNAVKETLERCRAAWLDLEHIKAHREAMGDVLEDDYQRRRDEVIEQTKTALALIERLRGNDSYWVLMHYYIDHRTWREVAELCAMSERMVYFTRNKAIAELERCAENTP